MLAPWTDAKRGTRATAAAILVAGWWFLTAGAGSAGGENIVFPKGACVTNIREAPYKAKGDGKTDDTAAFQKALLAQPKNTLIYVPDGTYVISDTLRWGTRQTRQVLQGQSMDGTILRLKDQCPGYQDPARPKAMVWTGQKPAQRFRNGIRNLTFDIGRGNPGAIGVQFIANNQGGVEHVRIQSPDEHGVIGLDLGYTNEQGPCLIRHVHVIGFGIGIMTRYAVDSVTLEHITVEKQRQYGFVNERQCLSIRKFRSVNAVTGFFNSKGGSVSTLLDSQIKGAAGAEDVPAVLNASTDGEAGVFVRNLVTSGYKVAIENRCGTKQGAPGPNVDEFVSHPVLSLFPSPKRSLNLPIKETPEVPWGDPKDWTCVGDLQPATTGTGPKATRNYAEAVQKAIDAGATTVCFPNARWGRGVGPNGQQLPLYGSIHVRGKVRRIIGCEGELGRAGRGSAALAPTFIIEDGEAPVVVIERFDTIYAGLRIIHRSGRTLVVHSLAASPIVIEKGAGDVFIDDVVSGSVRLHGGRLWARQLNVEGRGEPKVLNDGGDLWILGIKTEGDSTAVDTRGGGRTEVAGGFIYANGNSDPQKKMFRNHDSSLSFTIGELVIRNQPFHPVLEVRDGVTKELPKGTNAYRGQGTLISLYTGYRAPRD